MEQFFTVRIAKVLPDGSTSGMFPCLIRSNIGCFLVRNYFLHIQFEFPIVKSDGTRQSTLFFHYQCNLNKYLMYIKGR